MWKTLVAMRRLMPEHKHISRHQKSVIKWNVFYDVVSIYFELCVHTFNHVRSSHSIMHEHRITDGIDEIGFFFSCGKNINKYVYLFIWGGIIFSSHKYTSLPLIERKITWKWKAQCHIAWCYFFWGFLIAISAFQSLREKCQKWMPWVFFFSFSTLDGNKIFIARRVGNAIPIWKKKIGYCIAMKWITTAMRMLSVYVNKKSNWTWTSRWMRCSLRVIQCNHPWAHFRSKSDFFDIARAEYPGKIRSLNYTKTRK